MCDTMSISLIVRSFTLSPEDKLDEFEERYFCRIDEERLVVNAVQ